MDYLRIADLLHPDTMNFLLEASGLLDLADDEAAGPILVRLDPDGWVAVVPNPKLDGYLRVPVLRRLCRIDDSSWRHFPMETPGASQTQGYPTHEYETAGSLVLMKALDELPTWTCGAALAASEGRERSESGA